MGTRSATYFLDETGPVACLYRQFDGHPEGHGAELARFLDETEANGIGNLAVQACAHFSEGSLGFYLTDPHRRAGSMGEEFVYRVDEDRTVTVWALFDEALLFKGSPSDLLAEVSSAGVDGNPA